MKDIFQEACLVQMSTSCWQGSRILEPSVMEEVGDSDWLRGRKYLVNPETLHPIRAVIGRARKDLEKKALPFPIHGLTLVPKEQIGNVEEVLSLHRSTFYEAVQQFEEGYEEAREMARSSLGKLFNETDYPAQIRSKFGFSWTYLTIETPGRHSILTPEIYEREKAKFAAMMQETEELCIAALRAEFAENVAHIVNRLTSEESEKPKIFKRSMMEKMQAFLDSFEARNLFDDDELQRLVSEARRVVGGVSASALREDPFLKHQIAAEMGKVKDALNLALVDIPRRKIHIQEPRSFAA